MVAIEFALTAPVFLLIVFFAIALCLELFTQETMDSATHEAARQLQIGTIRSATVADVRNLVCQRMGVLVSSCSSIQINVTSGTKFSYLTPAASNGTVLSSTAYSPGSSQSMVLIQVAYPYGFRFPITGLGSLLLVSSAAFENEP